MIKIRSPEHVNLDEFQIVLNRNGRVNPRLIAME